GQGRDDQVVGVAEHVGHHLVGQRAVEGDRVPVPLVQVITGSDGRVGGPQLDRELWLAFKAQLQRIAVQVAEREHLPRDLEYRYLAPERKVLHRTGQGQARRLEFLCIHDAPSTVKETVPGPGRWLSRYAPAAAARNR